MILETQEVTAENAQEIIDSFTGGGDAPAATDGGPLNDWRRRRGHHRR